jgi:hypothetical protein
MFTREANTGTLFAFRTVAATTGLRDTMLFDVKNPTANEPDNILTNG